MPLTNERINELAAKCGVRSIAVGNFLRSLARQSKRDAEANLAQDASLYRWSARTVATIRTGIREAYAPTKPAETKPRKRAPARDREWEREHAMQLGMGLGVEAYNDAMGYGSDES